ncbi:MAG: DUF2804 domain-containing protein [Candidatus Nanopelagicales bacterium]
MTARLSHEPEITLPVDLCAPQGSLNPAAVGWTRKPLHRANLTGWGRTKRWEYWCVQGPDHVLALTVSSIDYLALHTVWFMTYDGVEIDKTAIIPLGRVALPQRSGDGEVGVRSAGVQIRIEPLDDTIRLRAKTDRISADVTVTRPPGHESLGVVIPWTDQRFQYTVKDNTLPAVGAVVADGVRYRFAADDSYAVLDHGRGRWPYRTTWNWGSASGRQDHHTIGLQFGGKWTDGTGMTENALCVDGRLHKIGADLTWDYDPDNWLRPWRVRDETDGRVDVTFAPSFERRARTEAVVIATEVHQCFGTWSGTVSTDTGEVLALHDLRGFAEEARMRW